MAERESLNIDDHAAHQACGCAPAKTTEVKNCRVIKCGKCPERIKVEKKGEVRFQIDFSSCVYCEDGKCDDQKQFFLLGLPKGKHKNPPNCITSNGQINLKSLNMNQETGQLWLTIDAFDPRLNNGEIRRFKWYFRAPDMTRKSLTFDVCVGPT